MTSGAATATEATATGGTAYALVKATGGAGGVGTNGAGGTVSDLSASAYGFNARAAVSASGGSGGGGYSTGDTAGAGASVTLNNAVSGKSRGGTITLSQTVSGGAGGYGFEQGGAGGNANSSLSFTDTGTIQASSVSVSVSATGGAGAKGRDYNRIAGKGGAATIGNVTAVGTNNVSSQAIAIGGAGGYGVVGGFAGAATVGSVTATSSGAGGTAIAVGSAIGGNGGTSIYLVGASSSGGKASVGKVTASGFNAYATAIQTGGSGGFTPQYAKGGYGAASTLTNDVSVQSSGGTEKLTQNAIGGNGANLSGAGGAGSSSLSFNDTLNPQQAASLNAYALGQGGTGGFGTLDPMYGFPPGGTGGTGSVALNVTGAHYVHAVARGYGGGGGIGGSASGTVAATSTTTGTQNAKALLYLVAGSSTTYSSIGVGLLGAAVTSGAARATEATATGGTAYAQLEATGGAGATSYRQFANYATGGAGGTVSNLSAHAYGFNARATVTGTGGAGVGQGGQPSIPVVTTGGAGGSVTLNNAVSGRSRGGSITLGQYANGGAGGNGSGSVPGGTNYGLYGNGGAGGDASSSLTFSDTVNPISASSVSTYVNAAGGAGGGSQYYTGGAGGAASASNTSTSRNAGYAHASAIGGAGGSGATAGAGGIATATAADTATGLVSGATARAIASATGGSGLKQGSATASATATTANGQESQATATGDGSADSFTATASTSASGVLLGLTDTAKVTGGGKMTTVAAATVGGASPGFASSADNAYSDADGDPSSAEVASLVSGKSKVAAELDTTNAVDFADGTQGAYESSASGTPSFTSSETFHLDAAHLMGDLVLGFLSPKATGSGLTDATLTVTVGSGAAQVFTETSLAAANSFFSDDAVNLGRFTAAASLAVTVSLSETFSGAGSGYAVDYLIGTTGSGSLSILAPGAQVLGVGKAKSITGLSLSPSNTLANETFTATLADSKGDLEVAAKGATLTGNDTTSLSITGSLTQVNAALATLSDSDAMSGGDTITVNASDSLGAAATRQTIGVTVNGLPVLSVPGAQTLTSGVAKAITGVKLTETGKTGAPESFTATLADTHGKLTVTANGATVTGDGTTKLSITGLLTQVDAALASLSDTDSTVGADSISLNARDGFGNTATSASIAVTVKAPGTIRPDASLNPYADSFKRFGALSDEADHLAATLQLLNQYVHQFGVNTSDYSTSSDGGGRMPGKIFTVEHAGNLELRHWTMR